LDYIINPPIKASKVQVSSVPKTPEPEKPVEVSRGYERYRNATFNVSAYTDSSDEGNGRTSLGKQVVNWNEPGPATASVDPQLITYGTYLYIPYFKDYPCQGLFIAGDCGGAIRGYKLDLGAPSKEDAFKFGRRNLQVYILDENFKGGS